MATQAAQAGPSQRARMPNGHSGRSPSLPTRSGGAVLQEDDSDYEEDDGSEHESEEEIAYATVKGKGKGTAVPPLPRPQIPSPRSTPYSRERSGTSWADLDLSIIVACVSPIGNWLTGGDHIKNLFLIILLIFYLHQLIEVPWKLYQASRPRKSGMRAGEPDRVTKLAATELRRQELFLLCVTGVSPLLGATFLKHVLSAIGETESLSWFSTTLFVLATGIRPWTHLISRIQGHTEALHDAIHYPPEKHETEDVTVNAMLLKRLDILDREVQELNARTTLAGRLQEVCDDLSEALGEVERDAKRSERKTEMARMALAARVLALEKGLLQVEQNRRMDIDAFRRGYVAPAYERAYRRVWSYVRTFVVGVLRLPKTVWSLGAPDTPLEKLVGGSSSSPLPSSQSTSRSSNGTAHHRLSSSGAPDPSLPTIPESALSDGEAELNGEGDADSEGTYVTDNEKDHHSTVNDAHHKARRVRSKSGSRSRSRSHSGGSSAARKRAAQAAPVSFHQWVLECAHTILLWPYRASVRIMVVLVPPLRNVLPKAVV
ncbi:uncharacterized protein B0H18DRAFT_1027144 [Fomitopsis serialis]|uniref:uncharacterized protein n=1 Tax=Fomitopsis serialis TaxID=139415 RepID=UPI002008172E|nr:uncharacterized protein B0H18DRAFT_1027144 [Neoantrodia serialis]KAH9919610.1 hypothetical protein B0H18DRAFT_1027144 [Neoantrodia serialis]